MTGVTINGPKAEVTGQDAPSRKMFIKSYGCQMNAYDATRMSDMLAPQGYADTSVIEEADLVILNTCHIRERASEKVFSELGKIRILKQERAARGLHTMIAVAGCVAQAEGGEIFRRQKAVDLVVGPQGYHRLPELLDRARLVPGVVDTDFPVEDKFQHLIPAAATKTRQRGLSAFLTVQEGCDKFCTFCVVPYTRGAEFSRPVAQILTEAGRLARDGVREITLLGQNVNAYHGAGIDGCAVTLAQLLRMLAGLPGIARLRYMTSHPTDMAHDLLQAHQDLPALMPFLHLPVQSGSDAVLQAMNRGHKAQAYLDLVERVRAARPDIALSSDFIVGFPGETEADFQATLALIGKVGFASTFFFKFSPRPGTPGADLPDQVPEDVKSERLARLQALVEAQRHAFNARMVGRKIEVLFEKPGRRPGQLAGKSPYLQPVLVDAPERLIGQVCRVRIVESGSNSLFGQLADEAGHPETPEVQA